MSASWETTSQWSMLRTKILQIQKVLASWKNSDVEYPAAKFVAKTTVAGNVLPAPDCVGCTFSATVSPPLTFAGEASWPATFLSCPRIRPPQLLFQGYSTLLHDSKPDGPALVVLGLLLLHLLGQLPPGCVGDKEGDVISSFSVPSFLLEIFVFLPQALFPSSKCLFHFQQQLCRWTLENELGLSADKN